jgi:hypothetical protein
MALLMYGRTLEMLSSLVSAADKEFCFVSISFVCSAFIWLLVDYFRSCTLNLFSFSYK